MNRRTSQRKKGATRSTCRPCGSVFRNPDGSTRPKMIGAAASGAATSGARRSTRCAQTSLAVPRRRRRGTRRTVPQTVQERFGGGPEPRGTKGFLGFGARGGWRCGRGARRRATARNKYPQREQRCATMVVGAVREGLDGDRLTPPTRDGKPAASTRAGCRHGGTPLPSHPMAPDHRKTQAEVFGASVLSEACHGRRHHRLASFSDSSPCSCSLHAPSSITGIDAEATDHMSADDIVGARPR